MAAGGALAAEKVGETLVDEGRGEAAACVVDLVVGRSGRALKVRVYSERRKAVGP
jgi:hypothetical protein